MHLVYSAVIVLVLCNVSRAEPTNGTAASTNDVRPLIVLEYKPISSFHHTKPFTLGQLVSAGTPWPDSAQTTQKPPPVVAEIEPTRDLGNQSSTLGPVSSVESEPSVENKFGKEVDQPAIVLGYKPTRPPYVPDPVTIGQLIPSGTPWPDSLEGYKTTMRPVGVSNVTTNKKPILSSGTQLPDLPTAILKPSQSENEYQPPATVLEYKPTRPSFLPEPVTIGQLIPSGTPWPDSPEGYKTTIRPSVGVNNVTTNEKPIHPSGTQLPDLANTTLKPSQSENENQPPATVLEYKPTRPSFLPEPVTVGQLIPSGTPWPDSATGDKTTPKSSTVAQEVQPSEKTSRTRISQTTHKVLEYTPQRPWYLPEPVTIGQLIPPGTPWPDSPTAKPSPIAQQTHVKPESTTSRRTTTIKFTTQRPFSSTHIVLGYRPTRPWYLPEPVTIGQIIQSGKPWPAHADDFNAKKPRSELRED